MTGNLLAQALQDEFPEILHVTRLGSWPHIDLRYNNNIKIEKKRKEYLRADPSVLDVFDITLVHGDPRTALKDPNSIILTEELAMELCGDEDPMGKIITITEANFQQQAFNNPNTEFIVTGIAKALPGNSHFDLNLLIPYGEDWEDGYLDSPLGTYIVLPKEYPPERLEEKFPGLIKKYFGPEIEEAFGTSYNEWEKSGEIRRLHLQPLKDIHLDSYYTEDCVSTRKGNKKYIYLLSIIAFFILLLACINFMIMATARSANRAKEIGIRKIEGANREQLIGQFLTESILISLMALIISIPLVKLLLPTFNDFVGTQISLVFSSTLLVLPILLVLALIVGILAGAYPAFILAANQPIEALSGGMKKKIGVLSLRNGLIVFQFIISITLIVASLIVYKQLFFVQNNDPGFDREGIVVINIGETLLQSKSEIDIRKKGYEFYRNQRFLIPQTFKQELLKHTNVINATVARPVP